MSVGKSLPTTLYFDLESYLTAWARKMFKLSKDKEPDGLDLRFNFKRIKIIHGQVEYSDLCWVEKQSSVPTSDPSSCEININITTIPNTDDCGCAKTANNIPDNQLSDLDYQREGLIESTTQSESRFELEHGIKWPNPVINDDDVWKMSIKLTLPEKLLKGPVTGFQSELILVSSVPGYHFTAINNLHPVNDRDCGNKLKPHQLDGRFRIVTTLYGRIIGRFTDPVHNDKFVLCVEGDLGTILNEQEEAGKNCDLNFSTRLGKVDDSKVLRREVLTETCGKCSFRYSVIKQEKVE